MVRRTRFWRYAGSIDNEGQRVTLKLNKTVDGRPSLDSVADQIEIRNLLRSRIGPEIDRPLRRYAVRFQKRGDGRWWHDDLTDNTGTIIGRSILAAHLEKAKFQQAQPPPLWTSPDWPPVFLINLTSSITIVLSIALSMS